MTYRILFHFRRLIALLVVLSTTPAMAAWYEARSRHFIVYSAGTPERVGKFASDLERFDQALRKMLGYADIEGDDANPVTVYALGGANAVASLCSSGRTEAKECRYVQGFYNTRVSGAVAFVPDRSGASGGLDAREILFHEYAHHLMLGYSGYVYPAWYVEGFAELVSYAKLDERGRVGIGLSADSRGGSLYTIMKMSALLEADMAKMSPDQRLDFYAQAWLLTHYLTFSPKRTGQITAYLQAINNGVPARQAATSGFGDLAILESELKRYVQQKRMPFLSIAIPELPAGAIRLRQLSAGEAAMMPIRIRSDRGVNKETAPAVAADAQRIAASYADDPRAQDILAEAAFDADELGVAEAAVDRALARDPADVHGMLYKAQVLMARAGQAGGRDADWKAVRQWLVKANAIVPDAAWPLYLFYQSYREQGIRPTANAIAGLERAFVLVPQDGSVRMSLVDQYLADNRLAEARAALAPLAFDPHLPPGSSAATLLAEIDARLKAAKDQAPANASTSNTR